MNEKSIDQSDTKEPINIDKGEDKFPALCLEYVLRMIDYPKKDKIQGLSMHDFMAYNYYTYLGELTPVFDRENLLEGQILVVKYGTSWAHIGLIRENNLIEHKFHNKVYMSNIEGMVQEFFKDFPAYFYIIKRNNIL